MNPINVRLRATLLFAAMAALGGAATAQAPIYRCGDSYSQTPCAGGKIIAASDSRSPDQKAQTDEATKRNAKAASEMEKARVKEDAKAPHAVLPLAAKPEEKPVVKKQKAEKPFSAVSSKSGDDKKKKKSKKKKEKA